MTNYDWRLTIAGMPSAECQLPDGLSQWDGHEPAPASGTAHSAFRCLRLIAIVLLTTSALAQSPRGVNVAKPRDILVSADWLAKHRTDANLLLLHVAWTRSNYEAGHIPGAVFLSLNDILATRNGVLNELPDDADLQRAFERVGAGDDKRIILYATGDHAAVLAARAWFSLDYLGHADHAALLDGGWERWKSSGHEGSTASVEPKPAALTIHPRRELLVDTERMRTLSADAARGGGEYVLLDSRPEDEFSGANAGEDVPRAGHIPGAVSLYWPHLLDDYGELLPPHDLRETLAKHGVTPDKKVVNYCRTGVQASFDYFVLRYLGYDASLYDGSFMEWSKTEGTKVEK